MKLQLCMFCCMYTSCGLANRINLCDIMNKIGGVDVGTVCLETP